MDIFSPEKDEQDFQNDVQDLKAQQEDLVRLLFQVSGEKEYIDKKEEFPVMIEKEIAKLEDLLRQQVNTRSSYRTIRNPAAQLTIESRNLTFDSVIGKGGFGVVWKGIFEGNTVVLINVGGYKKNFSWNVI